MILTSWVKILKDNLQNFVYAGHVADPRQSASDGAYGWVESSSVCGRQGEARGLLGNEGEHCWEDSESTMSSFEV